MTSPFKKPVFKNDWKLFLSFQGGYFQYNEGKIFLRNSKKYFDICL